jgi:hypothetical protein
MLAKVKLPGGDRIWNEYLKAEARVLVPGSGAKDAEKFAADLRAIDLAGAPWDVQKGMAYYIAAVEANLEAHRSGVKGVTTLDRFDFLYFSELNVAE